MGKEEQAKYELCEQILIDAKRIRRAGGGHIKFVKEGMRFSIGGTDDGNADTKHESVSL